MPRRLLVFVLALALVSAAGCGGDDDDHPPAPSAPPPIVATALTPLEVSVDDPGAEPRELMVQELRPDAEWRGGLQFELVIESITSARIFGDSTLSVHTIDDGGNAQASYSLDGLDLAVGAGNGEPGTPTPDALDITGDLVIDPSRSVTSATRPVVASDGSVPGIDGIAGSLDPRLSFILFPFPDEPVGVGARWTVSGPLPFFGTVVDLRAEVQLVERRHGRYRLTLAVGMRTPEGAEGPPMVLQGIGRVAGDLHQLGVRSGSIGISGTIVLPDRGPERLPMSLRLDVDER